MSNLKKFLRKNLASVIVLVALVLIAGVALVTKFSVNADTASTNLGAEVNYADEDTTVADAGEPIAADETLDEVTAVVDGTSDGSKAVVSTSSTSIATSIATSTATTSPVVYKQGLKGTYFKDKRLFQAVFARLDQAVNWSWGNTAPAAGVPANGFSVRWNGFITPKYSETYTFKIQHNDGVRLYVNNKTIIDKWANNPTTALQTDTGTIALKANQKYSIKVEYYDNVTNAQIKMLWKSTSQTEQIVSKESFSTAYNPNPANGTGNGVIGTYFNTINFASRVAARKDNTINFDWGSGSPMTKVSPDRFSVIWTGLVQPKFTEAYTFYTKSSDGVRLWINGVKVIDQWANQPNAKENNGAIRLVKGQKYNIRLQYYEYTGNASSVLMWSSPSQRKQVIPKSQLYSGAVVNPTPSASTTATTSATVTSTSVTDKMTVKKGFNTVIVGASQGLIATNTFTKKGMKVFAFNRDGKYYAHPTSALNWETSLQFMNHDTGYYVYNPGAQVAVTFDYVTSIEKATDKYATTGWNLLGNSTATASKLADIKTYLSSDCSVSATGVASCNTAGKLYTLRELIDLKRGYTVIPVIKNGNTSDAAKAFDYITVTSDNIDTVTIPAGTAYWFFIFK